MSIDWFMTSDQFAIYRRGHFDSVMDIDQCL